MKPARRWRWLAMALVGLVVMAAGLWWWLSAVPVSLSVLRNTVTARLEALAPGLTVTIGTLSARRDPLDGTVIVTARELMMRHPDLPGTLTLDRLALEVDAPALLGGKVLLRTAAVEGVRGRLTWSAEALLRALDEPSDGAVPRLPWLDGLRAVTIDDGVIDLEETAGGREQRLTLSRLDLKRPDGRSGIRLGVESSLLQGSSRLSLSASGIAQPAGAWLMRVRASGQLIDGFAANFPSLPPFSLDAPLIASATIRATDTLKADGVFKLDAGRFSLARHFPERLPFASASGQVSWSKQADRLALNAVSIDLRPARVTIDEASIPLSAPAQTVLRGRLDDLSTADLVRYWPQTVSRGGRKWIGENIQIGQIDNGRITLSPGSRGPSVKLVFDFRGLETHYRRPMPPLIQASGTGVLRETGLQLAVASGRINGLNVSPSRVDIIDFGKKPETVLVDLALAGSTAQLLDVLDHEPLGFISRHGVEPRSVGGTMTARVKLTIPLLKKLKTDQIGVEAQAQTQAAYVPDVFLGKPLTRGRLAFQIDDRGLVARGPASLGDEPVNLVWREDFGGNGRPGSSSYDIRAMTDDDGLRRIGIELGSLIDGPVDVTAAVTTRKGVIVDGRLAADLTKAALELPVAGTVKPRGASGRFASRLVQRGDDILLPDLTVRSGALDAAGFVAIAKGGEMVSADIRQFRAGAHDLAARVVYKAGQSIDVALTGQQIDLRPFLADLYGATLEGPEATAASVSVPVKASARIARVLLLGGSAMDQASGTLTYAQERVTAATLKAQLGSGNGVTMTLQDRGGSGMKRFVATAADAGAMAGALGLFAHGQGGNMTIDADLSGSGPQLALAGQMKVRDFRVTKAPVLARTLTLASLTGLRDTMMGQGIEFRTIDVPFTLERGVLKVKGGRAIGAAMGVTIEGEALQSLSQTSFKGVIVPSYTLNALVGKIPLLGRLIVGGKDQGLIGFNYRIEGKATDPKVTVQGASGLAPGFLRNLFNLRPAKVEAEGG